MIKFNAAHNYSSYLKYLNNQQKNSKVNYDTKIISIFSPKPLDMLDMNCCAQTPLLPTSKKFSFNISESEINTPPETCLSLNSEQSFAPLIFIRSPEMSIEKHFLSKSEWTGDDESDYHYDKDSCFSTEIYDRINDYFDQEGLFAIIPEPCSNDKYSPKTVFLQPTPSLTELSGAGLDSSFPSIPKGPKFLMRRNKSFAPHAHHKSSLTTSLSTIKISLNKSC